MTSIFQTLIDFLQFFFNPLYIAIQSICWWILHLLLDILSYIITIFAMLLNAVFYAFGWAIDKFLVLSIGGIQTIFTSTIFRNLSTSSSQTSLVSNLLNYGCVGISWVQHFVNIGTVLAPFIVYVGFLLFWTSYKFIKSWIPTIGS